MRIALLLLFLLLGSTVAVHAQEKKDGKKTEKKAPEKKKKKKKKNATEITQENELIDIEQQQAIEEIDKELIPEKELEKRKEEKEKEKEEKPKKEKKQKTGVAAEATDEEVSGNADKNVKTAKRENRGIKPSPVKTAKKQKKVKPRLKISKAQKEEFIHYAERLYPNPDSADISIKLPVTTPQNRDEVRFSKAVELINNHFPDKALVILKQMHRYRENDPNINYWLGRAYLQSYSGNDKALPYFKKASEKTDFKYNFKDPFKNKRAPVNALYYLGRAYHLTGDIEMARRTFQIYAGVSGKKDKLAPLALLHIKQLDIAEQLLANAQADVRIKNLGDKINSLYADFAPMLTHDGTELFFTSARPFEDSTGAKAVIDYQTGRYYNDIYVARLISGRWETPQPLSLNSADNEILNGISPNSKIISLFIEGDTYADYFESTYAFDTWQAPIEILETTNTLKWGRHFAITPDRSKIYFASTKLGGFGGSDLFMVERLPNGKWSKPINLGNRVNTKYNEDIPTLHPDGRTLFFCSDGEKSMGGYDIFTTAYTGEWNTPQNIGAPVNTFHDDLHFSLAYDGKTAYYSKQENGGVGDLDIYQVTYTSGGFKENPKLEASFNVDLKNLDNSTEIEITNIITQEKKSYRPNIRTGLFTVSVEPCTRYNIAYRKQGVTIRTEEFLSPCDVKP